MALYIWGAAEPLKSSNAVSASGGGESLIHYPPLSFCLHHQPSHAISYFTLHDKKRSFHNVPVLFGIIGPSS